MCSQFYLLNSSTLIDLWVLFVIAANEYGKNQLGLVDEDVCSSKHSTAVQYHVVKDILDGSSFMWH